MGGNQSERFRTVAQNWLILPLKVGPRALRAGPAGIGTSTVSRGSVNITTWLVAGSIESTIIVSVLWPPFCSSAPISRMLRRDLPSQLAWPAGVSMGGPTVPPTLLPGSSPDEPG